MSILLSIALRSEEGIDECMVSSRGTDGKLLPPGLWRVTRCCQDGGPEIGTLLKIEEMKPSWVNQIRAWEEVNRTIGGHADDLLE